MVLDLLYFIKSNDFCAKLRLILAAISYGFLVNHMRMHVVMVH